MSLWTEDDYRDWSRTLDERGAGPALADLCERLTAAGAYHRLFEGLTLSARHDLGLPLVQLADDTLADGALRQAYEDRIVDACRTVGRRFLDDGDLAAAYQYFQMIGETAPVKDALRDWRPPTDDTADEALGPILDLCLGQGLDPSRGLELVAAHYGTCQAVTTGEGLFAGATSPPDRRRCAALLVRTLHAELLERLRAEIARRADATPVGDSVPELLADREWLFADEGYHIDTSHLASVTRLARVLRDEPEVALAAELAEYGTRLSDRYVYPEPPPFDDGYADTLAYFRTLAGTDADAGVERFRAKAAAADRHEVGTLPAETVVVLLHRVGRTAEALDYAAEHLNDAAPRPAAGPSVNDLCQQQGRFDRMAELARRRDDPISFVAAKVQQAAG